jgi:hypothetical protein
MLAAVSSAAHADVALDALEFEAARGDPAAQTDLAVLYEHAEGLAKDLKRAGALYCEAARHGYADAQFKLGWIYANGRGLPRDDGIAAALFEKAAAQGHPDAAKLLAHIRPQPDTQMPPCLAPDPVIQIARDEPVEPVDGLAEAKSALAETQSALAADQGRTPIERLVYNIAPGYAVDPELALAMIAVESNFNPVAVSPKNAQGLMQLIPETAQRFGVKRVFDPVDNINGGLAYIRWLLAFFQGNVQLVIAAYNAGEGAVEKYRGIPPYAETRKYVQKITGMYRKAKHPYEERVVSPSALVAGGKRGGG